jgi:hypothetical protein
LGEALIREGKTENALTVFNQLVEQLPGHLLSYAQVARINVGLNRFDEAIMVVESVQPHVSTSGTLPLWNNEPLGGKTLLLYSQFGLDEINLFSRFVNAIDKQGETIIIRGTPPTQALIASLPNVDECIASESDPVGVDFHSAIERLPGLLGLTPDTIGDVSGFPTDTENSDGIKNTFDGTDKKRVGIMWRKETDEKRDIFRSVPLAAFRTISEIPDIQLYSLQTACGKEELAGCMFQEKNIHISELENADLADRLAAVSHLDLLVTTDSFTGQIAVQAGLPAFVLLSTGAEWYYGFSGKRSAWLPSARLFRQQLRTDGVTATARVISYRRIRSLAKSQETYDYPPNEIHLDVEVRRPGREIYRVSKCRPWQPDGQDWWYVNKAARD